MRRFLLPLCLAAVAVALPCIPAHAQGTKLWNQSSYDEFEKGTAKGVAIRSDGHLEPAPATALVATTPSPYVWSIASDSAGNAYLGTGSGTGSPANILKVTPDGKSTKLAEFKELAVQALAFGPDGALYAATSPEGKVYHLPARAKAGAQPEVVFDPAQTSEKSKYLWALAFDAKNKVMYVAAGAPAAIYKINLAQLGAKPEVFFKSDDQHIRSLVLAPDGTVYAGSASSGVIYRIEPSGKSFALYDAPKAEITSLALDSTGNLYAAGVGNNKAANLPPLPVQGTATVTATITYILPGATHQNGNTLIPDGSEIYRITPDGTPQKLLSLHDDIVYDLAVQKDGSLLAATGNRGRIYDIDTKEIGRFTDVAHLDANQAIAFAPAKDGLFVATSNTGKLFTLANKPDAEPTYTSQVFDAGVFSQWGRMETRGIGTDFDLYARSGNVENPKQNWSDWQKITPEAAAAAIPAARYAQWKAVLHPGSSLDSVGLNYLAKNIAPVVDEVVVQPGARVVATAVQAAQNTVLINFTTAQNPVVTFQQNPAVAPLTAQKDKDSITTRWLAHDDNGDDLTYAIYYRGNGEINWRLLKDKITDTYYSFDAALLPDGGYEMKVVASDSPSHTPSEALTGSQISSHFVVDTTPPVLSPLTAQLARDGVHATLDAHDTTSPIDHAEYSLDAGPWQYLEPVGKISDSLREHYDFTAPIPPAQPNAPKVANPNEHVLTVRVYDRYDNMAAVKTVVK
ncbi:MAG: fibronectin type III domain-containing protein [Acidobacteriaceae bacterium]